MFDRSASSHRPWPGGGVTIALAAVLVLGSACAGSTDVAPEEASPEAPSGLETWTGTLTGEGINDPPGTCEPAAIYDYTFTIVVEEDDRATMSASGVTSSACATTTTENEFTVVGTRTATGFSFPGSEFPGTVTITVDGSAGTGTGAGSAEGGFSWELELAVEQL
ncbi:MAG: hypothetical protein ACRDGW_09015 [Actinomycetota bacterium]